MSERGLLLLGLGALSPVVAAGAKAWAEDLRLRMPWWKWVLAGLWYGLLNFTVAAGFTLRGENERRAGNAVLAFFGALTAALGVVLAAILWAGREPAKGDG